MKVQLHAGSPPPEKVASSQVKQWIYSWPHRVQIYDSKKLVHPVIACVLFLINALHFWILSSKPLLRSIYSISPCHEGTVCRTCKCLSVGSRALSMPPPLLLPEQPAKNIYNAFHIHGHIDVYATLEVENYYLGIENSIERLQIAYFTMEMWFLPQYCIL